MRFLYIVPCIVSASIFSGAAMSVALSIIVVFEMGPLAAHDAVFAVLLSARPAFCAGTQFSDDQDRCSCDKLSAAPRMIFAWVYFHSTPTVGKAQ